MTRKFIYAIMIASVLFLTSCGSSNAAGSAVTESMGSAVAQTSEQATSVASTAPEAAESTTAAQQIAAEEAASHLPASGSETITEEDARRIALEDAGILEENVSQMRVYLDGAEQEYEVEFYVGNQEYDYDISAGDGMIRSKDTEIEDDFAAPEEIPGEVIITEEEAINIFLEKVPGAPIEDVRIKLDRDDGGKLVFEGRVVFEGREYEIEIDGETGNVLEWDEEPLG